MLTDDEWRVTALKAVALIIAKGLIMAAAILGMAILLNECAGVKHLYGDSPTDLKRTEGKDG